MVGKALDGENMRLGKRERQALRNAQANEVGVKARRFRTPHSKARYASVSHNPLPRGKPSPKWGICDIVPSRKVIVYR